MNQKKLWAIKKATVELTYWTIALIAAIALGTAFCFGIIYAVSEYGAIAGVVILGAIILTSIGIPYWRSRYKFFMSTSNWKDHP